MRMGGADRVVPVSTGGVIDLCDDQTVGGVVDLFVDVVGYITG